MKTLAFLASCLVLAGCATNTTIPSINCDVISTRPIRADILRTCDELPKLTPNAEGKVTFGATSQDAQNSRAMYRQCKALDEAKLEYIKQEREDQRKACAAKPD